jgi:hypothetical protein
MPARPAIAAKITTPAHAAYATEVLTTSRTLSLSPRAE